MLFRSQEETINTERFHALAGLNEQTASKVLSDIDKHSNQVNDDGKIHSINPISIA